MTRNRRLPAQALLCFAWLVLAACQLKRPEMAPSRMIEPALPAPAAQAARTDGAPVRLVETQARAQIARRLLHRHADGELVEDPVWRWSTTPDHYLDSALRLAFASVNGVHLVDNAGAPVAAVTLVSWQIEDGSEVRIAAVVELTFTTTERAVRTQMITDSEPIAGELPGNLSAAAGRLLGRLAGETVKRVVAECAR